jgi:hypothetical protein
VWEGCFLLGESKSRPLLRREKMPTLNEMHLRGSLSRPCIDIGIFLGVKFPKSHLFE